MENKIKIKRKELGISQEELAKQCKVSRQTINAIENNKYDPTLSLAFSLARGLESQWMNYSPANRPKKAVIWENVPVLCCGIVIVAFLALQQGVLCVFSVVRAGPFTNRLKDGDNRKPFFGEAVFNVGRDLVKLLPFDEVICNQLSAGGRLKSYHFNSNLKKIPLEIPALSNKQAFWESRQTLFGLPIS